MSSDQRDTSQDSVPGGRMVALLRPYGGRMFFVLGLLVCLAFTNMALPYAIKLLIDDVFPQDQRAARWTLLLGILLALILIYVARNTLFYSSRMQSLRVSEDLCFSLRKRLFEHLQQLSMKFYHSNQPGRIGARVMDDTFKIQSFIQDKLPIFLLNLVTFQILVVFLCIVNLPLALTAMVVLPLQFVTYRYFKVSIRRSSSEAQENLASAYSNIVEKFLGMHVVKGFSAEQRESATFNRAIDASRRSQIRSQRYHFAQKVTADLLVGIGTVLLIGFGAYEVVKGRITSGQFIMFFSYVGMLYPAVLELISGAGHLSKATASIDRVFEMLDVPAMDEGVTDNQVEAWAIAGGAVELRDVMFSYDGQKDILKDLSFSVEPGERLAITGPSGSGKSTMLNLLPRFNKVTEGQVVVDGHDVNEIPLLTLRSSIAIAFQEVFLFNASIYENLRYARPDATIAEIEEACKVTGADEVVRRLPEGYATRIGEYGGELSRGEKQRITLARALLKDTPILVLDEATASIDAQAALEIMEGVFRRMIDRTIIMVTHDTSLLNLCDRVISIRQGSVAFDGSPEEYHERCVQDSPRWDKVRPSATAPANGTPREARREPAVVGEVGPMPAPDHDERDGKPVDAGEKAPPPQSSKGDGRPPTPTSTSTAASFARPRFVDSAAGSPKDR